VKMGSGFLVFAMLAVNVYRVVFKVQKYNKLLDIEKYYFYHRFIKK